MSQPAVANSNAQPEMDRQAIYAATVDHYLAPIKQYLEDASVTEVMVNRSDEIFIEKDGEMIKTDARFADQETYLAAINNILQYTGRSLYDNDSLIDARLPDGSRVHVAKEPAARHGTAMAIRKFGQSMLDIDWLVELGTLTDQARQYLNLMILSERNVVVAGGTSTGKTSLLNALSAIIPKNSRIVLIEDSAEMQLQQDHVVSMETKPPDRYGRGQVTIRDLFRSSLRLRPDRIIIGEVRGGEALDMIQAMTSGQGGSMGTLHANNPRDALSRLETMAMMGEVELPLHALRAQVASAIDCIVQMNRFVGGRRMVSHIAEVLPLGDDGNYKLRDLFLAKVKMGDEGEKTVQLEWTGERSILAGHLKPDMEARLTDLTRPLFAEQPTADNQSSEA
jgi:pilus assembly protein CpaF